MRLYLLHHDSSLHVLDKSALYSSSQGFLLCELQSWQPQAANSATHTWMSESPTATRSPGDFLACCFFILLVSFVRYETCLLVVFNFSHCTIERGSVHVYSGY